MNRELFQGTPEGLNARLGVLIAANPTMTLLNVVVTAAKSYYIIIWKV